MVVLRCGKRTRSPSPIKPRLRSRTCRPKEEPTPAPPPALVPVPEPTQPAHEPTTPSHAPTPKAVPVQNPPWVFTPEPTPTPPAVTPKDLPSTAPTPWWPSNPDTPAAAQTMEPSHPTTEEDQEGGMTGEGREQQSHAMQPGQAQETGSQPQGDVQAAAAQQQSSDGAANVTSQSQEADELLENLDEAAWHRRQFAFWPSVLADGPQSETAPPTTDALVDPHDQGFVARNGRSPFEFSVYMDAAEPCEPFQGAFDGLPRHVLTRRNSWRSSATNESEIERFAQPRREIETLNEPAEWRFVDADASASKEAEDRAKTKFGGWNGSGRLDESKVREIKQPVLQTCQALFVPQLDGDQARFKKSVEIYSRLAQHVARRFGMRLDNLLFPGSHETQVLAGAQEMLAAILTTQGHNAAIDFHAGMTLLAYADLVKIEYQKLQNMVVHDVDAFEATRIADRDEAVNGLAGWPFKPINRDTVRRIKCEAGMIAPGAVFRRLEMEALDQHQQDQAQQQQQQQPEQPEQQAQQEQGQGQEEQQEQQAQQEQGQQVQVQQPAEDEGDEVAEAAAEMQRAQDEPEDQSSETDSQKEAKAMSFKKALVSHRATRAQWSAANWFEGGSGYAPKERAQVQAPASAVAVAADKAVVLQRPVQEPGPNVESNVGPPASAGPSPETQATGAAVAAVATVAQAAGDADAHGGEAPTNPTEAGAQPGPAAVATPPDPAGGISLEQLEQLATSSGFFAQVAQPFDPPAEPYTNLGPLFAPVAAPVPAYPPNNAIPSGSNQVLPFPPRARVPVVPAEMTADENELQASLAGLADNSIALLQPQQDGLRWDRYVDEANQFSWNVAGNIGNHPGARQDESESDS